MVRTFPHVPPAQERTGDSGSAPMTRSSAISPVPKIIGLLVATVMSISRRERRSRLWIRISLQPDMYKIRSVGGGRNRGVEIVSDRLQMGDRQVPLKGGHQSAERHDLAAKWRQYKKRAAHLVEYRFAEIVEPQNRSVQIEGIPLVSVHDV